MSDRPRGRSTALLVAIVAVMTAVTAVFTAMIQIPSPAKGYFNFSDVAVYFTAFAIGPFAASIAGGVGTALADVMSGFAQWAPISLLAHGLQGLVAGLIASAARKPVGAAPGRPAAPLAWILGAVAGAVLMVGLYLLGGLLISGGAALAEVPGNAVQTGIGAVLGAGFAMVVHRAYPPARDLRW